MSTATPGAVLRRVVIAASLLTSLLIVAAIVVMTYGGYRVRGPGMAPTLPDGSAVLVNPLIKPDRLDLVVYEPLPGLDAVRRVVGMPGDRVRISGGNVEVQPGGTGEWQRVAGLPRVENESCCDPDGRRSDAPADALVPADSYFVLGDNLPVASDSRTHGFVPAERIHGVVMLSM
jgi:signal peptidase I